MTVIRYDPYSPETSQTKLLMLLFPSFSHFIFVCLLIKPNNFYIEKKNYFQSKQQKIQVVFP